MPPPLPSGLICFRAPPTKAHLVDAAQAQRRAQRRHVQEEHRKGSVLDPGAVIRDVIAHGRPDARRVPCEWWRTGLLVFTDLRPCNICSPSNHGHCLAPTWA